MCLKRSTGSSLGVRIASTLFGFCNVADSEVISEQSHAAS